MNKSLVLGQRGLVGLPEGAAPAEVPAGLGPADALSVRGAGGAQRAPPAAHEHVVPRVVELPRAVAAAETLEGRVGVHRGRAEVIHGDLGWSRTWSP